MHLFIKLILTQVGSRWVKVGQIRFEMLYFLPSLYHVFNDAVRYK